jgi:hypothetical protein
MSWYIPPRPLWLRWTLILVSTVIFFWTGAEDDRVWVAALLGTAFSGVSLAHWLTDAIAGRLLTGWQIWATWATFGGLTGGLGIFATVILMAFKDARHAHPFPDYPTGLLAATLDRAPIWALAGVLIGTGVYALWRAHSQR